MAANPYDQFDAAANPYDQFDQPASWKDRVRAGAAGFNQGAAYLATSIPDAAANLMNLGKAGAGFTYHELTGKPIPQALEVNSGVSPLGAALADAMDNASHAYLPTRVDRPDDAASRYIAAGTSVLPAALAGSEGSALGALRNAAAAQIPVAAGQHVAETKPFDSDAKNAAASIAAQLAAGLVGPALAGGVRGMVRGGSASRQAMQDTIDTFEQAGAGTPSLGQATQRPSIQAIENVTGKVIGGQGVFQRKATAQAQGVSERVQQLVDALGGVRSKGQAGSALQQGIEDFKNRSIGPGGTYEQLDNAAMAAVPAGTRVMPSRTLPALSRAADPVPGMPATSAVIADAYPARLAQALMGDTAGSPAAPITGALLDANGKPLQTGMTPAMPPGAPFSDFRTMRSRVGERAFKDSNLVGSQEQGDLRMAYGAMSRDMAEALQGTPAQVPFARSNRYYSAASDRLAKLEPAFNKATPEDTFQSLQRSVNDDNLTQVRAVKRSLQPDEWKAQVSTITDKLGRATPGQQNAEGNAFSANTFLTNWAKMRPQVRSELYSGYAGSSGISEGLEQIAKTAETIRASSKVMQNNSGTGPFLESSHALLGAGAAVVAGRPKIALLALAPAPLSYVSARMLTSPSVVKWLADTTRLRSGAVLTHLAGLNSLIAEQRDPQMKADLQEYREALQGQLLQ